MHVPVLSVHKKPLMPTTPSRARRWIRDGKATPFFNRGIFCVRLNAEPSAEQTQPVALGIDPGSKKEGYSVLSAAHTYVNIQADAVTWVKDAKKTQREMRRARRFRKTPCRQNRMNRKRGELVPSTKARWQWKLRIATWLSKLLPITDIVVEDIQARTRKNGTRWNTSFSPLQVGKEWFYRQIARIANLHTRQGHETAEIRALLGLKKTSNKMAERFEAHCVDAWCLGREAVGGKTTPDNVRLLCVTPLRFHRRQLHRLQPEAGGRRKPYGGTRSHGFKRGSLVKHPKFGVAYIGGVLQNRLSLHNVATGTRVTQLAKPGDCHLLAYNSWRTRLLLGLNAGDSVA